MPSAAPGRAAVLGSADVAGLVYAVMGMGSAVMTSLQASVTLASSLGATISGAVAEASGAPAAFAISVGAGMVITATGLAVSRNSKGMLM